jgi:hypothetical protein
LFRLNRLIWCKSTYYFFKYGAKIAIFVVFVKKTPKSLVFYSFFLIFVRRKPKIMKPKVIHLLPSSLSARLSLWVMLFVAMLFLATFSLMFYYARQAVRAEAGGKA